MLSASVCQLLTTRIRNSILSTGVIPFFYLRHLAYGVRVHIWCNIGCKYGCAELRNVPEKYGWVVVGDLVKHEDYQHAGYKGWVLV